jgi:hypothetical protein
LIQSIKGKAASAVEKSLTEMPDVFWIAPGSREAGVKFENARKCGLTKCS